jgi:hypothetical protein
VGKNRSKDLGGCKDLKNCINSDGNGTAYPTSKKILRFTKTSCLLANPAREEAASALRKNLASATEAESAEAASAPKAESAKAASALGNPGKEKVENPASGLERVGKEKVETPASTQENQKEKVENLA